jgi:hypothetical protein
MVEITTLVQGERTTTRSNVLAVSPTSTHRYRQHWEERYDCAVALELTTSGHKRPHGAMIASRWPIVDAWTIDELPLPERSLVARIEHPWAG